MDMFEFGIAGFEAGAVMKDVVGSMASRNRTEEAGAIGEKCEIHAPSTVLT